MDRVPVNSSNVAEIGYDEDTQTLEVLFKNERVYQYFAVPSHVAGELMNAGSHGQYINQHIKGLYRYSRV